MTRYLPLLAALALLAAALAGCNASASLTESRAAPDLVPRFRHMLLISAVNDDGKNPAFPQLVAAGYRQAAARCRIEVEVISKGLDGQLVRPLDGPSDGMQLTAIPRTVENEAAGVHSYSFLAGYVATMTDRAAGRDLWKASLHVNSGPFTPSTDSDRHAIVVPAMLFARIAQDGILRGCTAPGKSAGARYDKVLVVAETRHHTPSV